MIKRKQITTLGICVLVIVASLMYNISALTLDTEKMQYLTASLASCSCLEVISCGSCARSGDTYSKCTAMNQHVACTGDGALPTDKCGCSEYSEDCGKYEDCHSDRTCTNCDETEDDCLGCSNNEEGTTACGS